MELFVSRRLPPNPQFLSAAPASDTRRAMRHHYLKKSRSYEIGKNGAVLGLDHAESTTAVPSASTSHAGKDRRVILRVAPHLNTFKGMDGCAACQNRVSGTGLVGPPTRKAYASMPSVRSQSMRHAGVIPVVGVGVALWVNSGSSMPDLL